LLGDIEGLEIEFGKDDFEEHKNSRETSVDDKYLKKYLEEKGGRLKC
jgi:hypothetical protein